MKDVIDILAPKLFNDKDKDYKKREHGLSISLGSVFRNCTLFPVKMSGGYPVYTFSRESIVRFCKAKDFGDEIINTIKQVKLSTNSTNSPNSTLSTDSTHSTQKSGESVESVESEGRKPTIQDAQERGEEE